MVEIAISAVCIHGQDCTSLAHLHGRLLARFSVRMVGLWAVGVNCMFPGIPAMLTVLVSSIQVVYEYCCILLQQIKPCCKMLLWHIIYWLV